MSTENENSSAQKPLPQEFQPSMFLLPAVNECPGEDWLSFDFALVEHWLSPVYTDGVFGISNTDR